MDGIVTFFSLQYLKHKSLSCIVNCYVVLLKSYVFLDLEYLALLNSLENKIENKDLPRDCELRQLSGCRDELSWVELGSGACIIVKNSSEILIPKSLRPEMLRILHLTHSCDSAMINQCKSKIFWPNFRRDLKKEYDECAKCQENSLKSKRT